jgi:PAP2 superfamily
VQADEVAPPEVRRDFIRGVRDWLPIVGILVAYLVLHELGETLEKVAHVDPQLAFDRWVFGGTVPTVRLQRALWDPGDPHWYDYLAWLVYLSHFVVTVTVAIVLWVRAYPLFRRFRALFLTVTFAGFFTYVTYPAIPPWLASERGDMPHTVRIVRAMWLELGLSDVAAVFGEKSRYAFPVGALPSLHAAWPFLLLVFFWPIAGKWRALLVGYALAMALTLVYSADHFVFDILLGWTYVIAVVIAFRFFARRSGVARVPLPHTNHAKS